MKQFVILSVLLVFSLPVGFSIAGCKGTNPNNYCNKSGFGYGLKTNAVAAINLPGNTTGISLAFGQTGQLQSPSATNCNGGAESVSTYVYGSTNLNLVDVSATGTLCGGTWNRHSPGGIPDYTICTAPTPAAIAAGCTGTTCLVQMTATADGVTSNTVPVWVHPAVTTIQLSVASPTTGAPGYQGCLSQNQTSQLDAVAYISSSATTPFCAPAGNTYGVPDCSVNLGHFTYTPVSAAIATIDQYGVATAHQPGSTAVTAAIANVSSTAGNLYTCPPASIQLADSQHHPQHRQRDGWDGHARNQRAFDHGRHRYPGQSDHRAYPRLLFHQSPGDIRGHRRSRLYDLSIDRGDYRGLQPADLQPLADHSDRPTWNWTPHRQ